MRILVAPDSFKGTLTPSQACQAIAEGIRNACPEADIASLPLADGGDGTLDALSQSIDLDIIRIQVRDALGNRVPAMIGTMAGGVAIIETAQSNGLSLLPPQLRDPMKTSTAGVGDLVAEAIQQGARKIVLALGGSATVDGGSGMAIRLGWRHMARDGKELEGCGGELTRLHKIIPPSRRPRLKACDAWVDVQTPLLGPQGAVPLFAPQKGATPADLPILEQGLGRLAECWKTDLDIDASTIPGGGAAGGLGAGARVYLGATLLPGADALFDLIDLERRLEWADCLVTGEGRLDQTSFHGKLIGSLFQRASRVGVPVLAVAGQFEEGIEHTAEFRKSLAMALSVSACCGAESAMSQPAKSLAYASAALMNNWRR